MEIFYSLAEEAVRIPIADPNDAKLEASCWSIRRCNEQQSRQTVYGKHSIGTVAEDVDAREAGAASELYRSVRRWVAKEQRSKVTVRRSDSPGDLRCAC